MHGGKSPGAPMDSLNGNYRNGWHTQEHRTLMKAAREMIRKSKAVLEDL